MLSLPACCSTPLPMPAPKPYAPVRSDEALKPIKSSPDAAAVWERKIRAVVDRWAGTPHKMGGSDHNGIDCSGFVQQVYLELFHLRLPRSTAQQVQVGLTVRPEELNAGDLVFFHPPNKIRHVGIYLSNGEFAHASAKQGVTVSSLHTPYWRDAYWTSKRINPGNT